MLILNNKRQEHFAYRNNRSFNTMNLEIKQNLNNFAVCASPIPRKKRRIFNYITVGKHKKITTANSQKTNPLSFTCCLIQEDKDPQHDAAMTM
jgi:hypothetical protein